MTVAATARRRRRQAAMGFTHLAPKQRPNYKKVDKAVGARRLEETIRREHERTARKGKKK